MKIKILSVFGTRPEAIKMAPLVKTLDEHEGFESRVAVTAQHREMLDQVLELFRIQPHHDLDIMHHGQTLSDITCRVLQGIGEIIQGERPHMVLVHGDTTTTFAAALASFYQKIPVGHVEAGLRTYDKYAPFPEEMNRQLTGSLGSLHFAPTERARESLLDESVHGDSIFVTGNTVIDALLETVRENYVFSDPLLKELDFEREKVILVTAHRRENWGEPMEEIFSALNEIVGKFEDIKIVFPVHKNPHLQRLARETLGGHPRVHLIDPLDYEPFVNLMAGSHIVLTDSGGLQEEAPALGKPVLVMRETTERPEAVEEGTVKLVGAKREKIVREVGKLLTCPKDYERMANALNPYGDGRASLRIRDTLLYYFGRRREMPEEFA
ncbi:MAG: UDP-N-acetylglucosamine 2-epimerase (non-hydrolyzing) [Clostridia bacterium]|nr:UDP-N-acetylglucosamine 2-epimerase (non-hydrolyzing) [Clostridia bacterium]